eukprot:CAMPEP_0194282724 /NCGR_PEP_ID=MMETSP0169-20130528/23727_1 /TAXON_ID=218684 /ORGANISM="Corethron pennatum, Strain L29A3" /LENGTH=989 /DNA_ID=CAMNT_0039028127 /DNA_START=128 /DNA_END=3097 /DNA_ORIENTATION=-
MSTIFSPVVYEIDDESDEDFSDVLGPDVVFGDDDDGGIQIETTLQTHLSGQSSESSSASAVVSAAASFAAPLPDPEPEHVLEHSAVAPAVDLATAPAAALPTAPGAAPTTAPLPDPTPEPESIPVPASKFAAEPGHSVMGITVPAHVAPIGVGNALMATKGMHHLQHLKNQQQQAQQSPPVEPPAEPGTSSVLPEVSHLPLAPSTGGPPPGREDVAPASSASASASASARPPPDSYFTVVSGIGMWNSWTRNFKTPLLAVLDLVDNSIDASLKNDDGAIQHALFVPAEKKNRVHINPARACPSGITLTNTCLTEVRPLSEVLSVYDSAKGKDRESIGENGVGLKQACAALSDCSFVVAKRSDITGHDGARTVQLSIGVLDRGLQKNHGCRLPAFDCSLRLTRSENSALTIAHNIGGGAPGVANRPPPTVIVEKISEAIEQAMHSDVEVIDSVANFGGILDVEKEQEGGTAKYSSESFLSMEGFRRGVQNLAANVVDLLDKPTWGGVAFRVLLAKLKHGQQKQDSLYTMEEAREKEETAQEESGSRLLLDVLTTELPRNYIHVPRAFDFVVDNRSVTFGSWQNRLVDMTKFVARISEKKLYSNPESEMTWVCEPEGYDMNIYIGFDPVRLADHDSEKKASLFIYSRQSGRLIKYIEDARSTLKLGASGSDYSQGLTVIVDDVNGKLPLNPTKQDIAFGEQAGGHIHEKNLYAWVGAISHFYWKRHLGKCREKTKTALACKVLSQAKAVAKAEAWCEDINNANLDVFSGLQWRKIHHLIRPVQSGKAASNFIEGIDTKFRMHTKKTISDEESDMGDEIAFRMNIPPPAHSRTPKQRNKKRKITNISEKEPDETTSSVNATSSVDAFMKKISSKKQSKKCKNCVVKDRDIDALSTKLGLMEKRIEKINTELKISNKSLKLALKRNVTSSASNSRKEKEEKQRVRQEKEQNEEMEKLKRRNQHLEAMMKGMVSQHGLLGAESDTDTDDSLTSI